MRVYDDKFNLVADLTLGYTNGTSLVNDVIVTKGAAYATDSFQPQYYKARKTLRALDKNVSKGTFPRIHFDILCLSHGTVIITPAERASREEH